MLPGMVFWNVSLQLWAPLTLPVGFHVMQIPTGKFYNRGDERRVNPGVRYISFTRKERPCNLLWCTSCMPKKIAYSYTPENSHSTWKWMVWILVSFWDDLFSGARDMFVFTAVDFSDKDDKDHSTPRSVHEKHFLYGVDWSCETSGMFFLQPDPCENGS